MATRAKPGRNEPAPQPIIVKKVVEAAHDAHHGGAWKIAYADFVTAMMAFFLLLWIIGATDENKKRGLADYFTPTLIEYKQDSAGSDGILGGDSIISADNYPHRATQTGSRAIVVPRDVTGGVREGEAPRTEDHQRFMQLREEILRRIQSDPNLRQLRNHVSFTEDDEGLRIDLMDEADFSMFRVGTDVLLPQARALVAQVASVIQGVPNQVVVRGHTDSLPYSSGQTMNNWMLSTARAESTRAALQSSGVPVTRISRIEGVADREPFVPNDRYDPRNRRISITLAWRSAGAVARPATNGPTAAGPAGPATGNPVVRAH
ncbi:flagellar motor protein MotB [Sphingosinicella ginsenosidimutans]|uniref:OmpA family protein n=1 Tax=Allosphingosinicella ginsenosidimutans TaxID=1176539 RepID=A0A5C6TV25_9SPHN|nr:flagellar motor protein MotB [Sphingosinicella ginsenosidimutans]TXC63821.1 OmpA family protein [Sphingosinicella ginsenosidimutans]